MYFVIGFVIGVFKKRDYDEDELGYDGIRRKPFEYVTEMCMVEKKSICGWHRNLPLDRMVKFTMAIPSMVAKARNALERANRDVTYRIIQTFEANVPFELRYMVDTKLAG